MTPEQSEQPGLKEEFISVLQNWMENLKDMEAEFAAYLQANPQLMDQTCLEREGALAVAEKYLKYGELHNLAKKLRGLILRINSEASKFRSNSCKHHG